MRAYIAFADSMASSTKSDDESLPSHNARRALSSLRFAKSSRKPRDQCQTKYHFSHGESLYHDSRTWD